MTFRLTLLVAFAVVAADVARAGGEEAEPRRVPLSPFSLPRDRIVPGTTFRIEISQEAAGAFDPGRDKVGLSLSYAAATADGRRLTRTVPLPAPFRRIVDGRLYIEARLPDVPDIRNQSPLGGVLHPYRATLLATVVREGSQPEKLDLPVQIPSVPWAYFWGVFAVLLVYVALALIQRRSVHDEEPGRSPWNPLAPVVTPVGGYSLSLAQVLLWTYVAVFGLVYVYWLTAGFLEITPQVLILLGIGGATALSTKLSRSKVPAHYLRLLPKREPAFRDLVWSAGPPAGPDLFKIQMLVFTLLTAYIVVVEIARTYAFPDIPENLVALMGVSSAVYVGNKVVQKGEQERRWEGVEQKVKATVEQLERAKEPDRAKLVTELGGMLRGLY